MKPDWEIKPSSNMFNIQIYKSILLCRIHFKMVHHKLVKSIHQTLLCSLPLGLIQRILLHLTMHFPWLFSFYKIARWL